MKNERKALLARLGEIQDTIADEDAFPVLCQIKDAFHATERALGWVHLHKQSPALQNAVRRLGLDVQQLLSIFPQIEVEIKEGNL